jgi:hypothetical protein
MYFSRSPYTAGNDAGMTFANFAAQFVTSTTIVDVPHGGTGKTSFTAFSVITAGITSTGAFQNVVGLGTSGQVLTSQGAGLLPVWAAVGAGGGVTSISAGTGITLAPNPIVSTGSVALTIPVAVTSGGTGLTSTTINQLLYSNANNVIAGLATVNRASLSTNATGVPTWLALTDGQVVIGSTAGAPAAASLTAGTGVTITPGSNSITIAATGTGGTVTSISAGAGITLTPNPITTTGTVAVTAANTNITSMTGLTGVLQAPTQINDSNGNAVLGFVGVASAVNRINIQNAPAAGPTVLIDAVGTSPLIAMQLRTKGGGNFVLNDTTGPTIIAMFNAGNTFSTNLKVCALTSSTTFTLPLADGTANASLVTDGAGNLSFSGSASGLTWNTVSGTTQALAINNGYVCTNGSLTTCSLPTTAAVFSLIHVVANTAAGFKITQAAGQAIRFGNTATTNGTGGSLQSTAVGDHVLMLNTTANTLWFVLAAQGNITVV